MSDEHQPVIQLEGRVSKLEGAMTTLVEEVKETSVNVREIGKALGGLKEQVFDRISVAAAPKTSLILTLVTLLITILGLGGTIIALMLSGQRDSIETLKAQTYALQTHQLSNEFKSGQVSVWGEQIQEELIPIKQEVKDIRAWKLQHARDTALVEGANTAQIDMLKQQLECMANSGNFDKLYQQLHKISETQSNMLLLHDKCTNCEDKK
jgi:hypothetical protein